MENRDNPDKIDNNGKDTIAGKGFIARTTYFYVSFKIRKGQIMNAQVALFFAVLLLQFIRLC